MNQLNLGCGRTILPGWVNLDTVALPGVDVVQDILKPPYPFPAEHFDRILCSHVLEHIPQIVNEKDGLLLVIEELHRILKPGGIIEIRGPHPRIGIHYFNNPTHYRVITEWTFDGLVGRNHHDSCVAFWSKARFSKMLVRSETFTDAPLDSELLKSVMRRLPFMRWLGRPAELVVVLTK